MTNYILPILIFLIIIFSYKKCNIYESFINGAKEGIKTSLLLFPSILAITFATNIFISSDFLNMIINILKPILTIIKFPSDLLPLLVLKPISASSVLSFTIDIFNKYNIDSKVSIISSVIYSNTDTSIYILSLYCGLLNIKNTKYAYKLCILINIISIIISIIVVNLLY